MEKLDLKYLESICRKMGVSEDFENLKKKIREFLERKE